MANLMSNYTVGEASQAGGSYAVMTYEAPVSGATTTSDPNKRNNVGQTWPRKVKKS